MIFKTFKKAFSLTELILAIGVFTILVGSLTVFSLDAYKAGYNSQKRIEASLLLKEVSNALITVKSNSWGNIIKNADGLPRKLVFSNGQYNLVNGTDTINGFTVNVAITVATRDSNGNIVLNGGSQDEKSRRIDISIVWKDNFNKSQSITSNLFVNDWNTFLWKQTTQAEFNQGTFSSTVSEANSDGEIRLDIVAYPDWCKPTLSLTSLDLPGNAVSTSVRAIQGEAFIGTGNNSSGINFMDIGISNAQPPVAKVLSTYTGNQANAVYGESNYIYVATSTDTKEVSIYSLTGILPTEVGSFNSPGTADGISVFVLNNKGYLTTTDNMLYIFDLSSKTGSRTQIGSKLLMGQGSEVQVVGNYAYISLTNGSHIELEVLDISNPANIIITGLGNTSQSDATDLYVNEDGSRAYVGTAASTTEKEFIIFDTSNRPSVSNQEYFQETANAVSIEAENFHSNITRSSKSWSSSSSIAGASGTYMTAGPDTGIGISTNYFNTSPELGYRVNFQDTGTFNFWIRAYVNNSNNNTVHGGYDGANYPTVEALSTTSYNSWKWFKGTIEIPTAEMHWINIWMSDDGFNLDKIYLTKANTTPSGTGPVESNRVTNSIVMPEINRQKGQYETSGMSIRGVTAVENNTRAILVGTSGEEYQVIDTTNELNPVRCGGLQLNSGITSIASIKENDNDSYSYIVTLEANNEFRVIRGGPGAGGGAGYEGAIYATNGTYISKILDTASISNFYSIGSNGTTPANTNLQFQVRSSNDPSQILSTIFTGPDGTINTFYNKNTTSSLNSNLNGNRYFQFKVFFTSDSSSTPILNDVSINYQK